jgi:hypothetical protein
MPEQHTSVITMGRYLQAWTNPTPDELLGLCARDITCHVSGSHALSGDYRGHDGLAELHQRVQAAAESNLELRSLGLLADARHAVEVLDMTLRHEARGRSLEQTAVGAVKVDEDGKIAQAWYLTEDQAAEDEFFA